MWTTNITYIWTLEGWFYVAVVIDLFLRQVVDWAINGHMRTSLYLDAMHITFWCSNPKPGH
ncbi:DDE-type integrase/transposase/recombinase [Methyloprofundus sp.]|uniref:DDE-type integrase/transposase/recombinase n=1 Tax=Methyloprofundus sp. TaxID=2020875 RepID=UPI00341DA6A9